MKNRDDYYVFISYASKDQEQANALYSVLTGSRNGFACWMDKQKIKFDKRAFQEQIVQGIQQASCIVLVDTRESQKSEYVKMELATAEMYKVPIVRYKASQTKWKFLNQLRLRWAIQRVQFRATQPVWFTLLGLLLLMGAMIVSVLFLGTETARAAERYLPEAMFASVVREDEKEVDPSIAAPFYFVPDYAQILDDFNEDISFNQRSDYYYDISPRGAEVEIDQDGGALYLFYPDWCADGDLMWECETEIRGKKIRWDYLQYFGFRARSVAYSDEQDISISISPQRRGYGFGWSFSDHATPFFHANSTFPEEDFYAYVALDHNWHTYEILLDPVMHTLFYYMDGQLIDTHGMQHYDEWVEDDSVKLVIYALSSGSKKDDEQISATRFEIDRLIVGGFR